MRSSASRTHWLSLSIATKETGRTRSKIVRYINENTMKWRAEATTSAGKKTSPFPRGLASATCGLAHRSTRPVLARTRTIGKLSDLAFAELNRRNIVPIIDLPLRHAGLHRQLPEFRLLQAILPLRARLCRAHSVDTALYPVIDVYICTGRLLHG
ncbi:hypothetical protein NOVOSPHI9U_210040 [Novosphingobium sp. 9U]|nr:hypothetical protein NOVOSPHI9U_210040 [Novosphingobium sp. 9U]